MPLKPKNRDLWQNLHKIRILRDFFDRLGHRTLIGSRQVPLRSVLKYFIQGLDHGFLGVRASAIAFHFFLALFPAIIALFTIIPYIRVENFQELLLNFLNTVIPSDSMKMVHHTITDIVVRPRAGLLSISTFLVLFFASSGISMIIAAFNNTYHYIEYRSWIKRRLIAFALSIVITTSLIITIVLMAFGNIALEYLVSHHWLRTDISIHLYHFVRYLLITLMLLFSISILYYFAPAKRKNFRFISHGAILTIILSIIITSGFNFYIKNFGRYNYLYGSLGALIIFLLWISLIATILIIGFEFDAAISQARKEQQQLGEQH